MCFEKNNEEEDNIFLVLCLIRLSSSHTTFSL